MNNMISDHRKDYYRRQLTLLHHEQVPFAGKVAPTVLLESLLVGEHLLAQRLRLRLRHVKVVARALQSHLQLNLGRVEVVGDLMALVVERQPAEHEAEHVLDKLKLLAFVHLLQLEHVLGHGVVVVPLLDRITRVALLHVRLALLQRGAQVALHECVILDRLLLERLLCRLRVADLLAPEALDRLEEGLVGFHQLEEGG